MDLRHLRYIVASARNGSFSAAAHEFNVRQPIISKRIKEVEEELKVKLFIRSTAGARLTPAGEAFVMEARRIIEDFDTALAGSDVVIMLRLQKERMQDALGLAEADYFAAYGLTAARLARAREDALVMHPGPMNRGIEIADAVADGSQSVILEQVANGIFVRMAVLAALLADR